MYHDIWASRRMWWICELWRHSYHTHLSVLRAAIGLAVSTSLCEVKVKTKVTLDFEFSREYASVDVLIGWFLLGSRTPLGHFQTVFKFWAVPLFDDPLFSPSNPNPKKPLSFFINMEEEKRVPCAPKGHITRTKIELIIQENILAFPFCWHRAYPGYVSFTWSTDDGW